MHAAPKMLSAEETIPFSISPFTMVTASEASGQLAWFAAAPLRSRQCCCLTEA